MRELGPATALTVALACNASGDPPPMARDVAEVHESTAAPDALADCIAHASGDTRRAPQLLRTLCGELTRTGTPGAALSIVGPDGHMLTLGVGYACDGQSRRVLPSTVFRIGSVTKALTAAATVRAARTDGLDLHAPIAAYLTTLPQAYAAATWRQLLDHSSGLPETEPRPDNAGLTGDALLSVLTVAPPLSAAGERHHYTNAGYAIVGLALSKATGRETTALLRGLVPATDDDPRPALHATDHAIETQACGHLMGQPFSMRDDFALFAHGAAWTFPAGGVVLSAPDLAGLAHSIIAELRADDTVATDDPAWRYALGLRRRTLPDGSEHWLHSGNTGDFAADLHVLPDRSLTVAVLANGGTPLRAAAFAALAHAAPQLDLASAPVGG